MRILLIGFIAFSIWSALSTYIYVCKINGLCYETIDMQAVAVKPQGVIVDDTLSKTLVRAQKLPPKDLIIYFDFDKYDLKPSSTLDNYIILSKAYFDQNSLAKISIIGHTDAIGSDEYNNTLSHQRAKVLQYYFESKGMLVNRIIIDSKGEKNPVADNNTNQGRADNRRSEITIKK